MIIVGVAAYVTFTLNLWGPIIKMTNAATQQALEIGKEKLREFLEAADNQRQPITMSGRGTGSDDISLHTLDSRGKRKTAAEEAEEDEEI